MMLSTTLPTHPSPPLLHRKVSRKMAVCKPGFVLTMSEFSLGVPSVNGRTFGISFAPSCPWNPLLASRRARHGFGTRLCLGQIPGPEHVDVAAVGVLSQFPDAVQGLVARAEGVLYTLADSAVVTSSGTAADAAQKQSGGWLGGLTDALEAILKVLKDGFSSLHVPYAYGFAIILLTVLVKVATFPLTKQQVESMLAMQNLSPKIKAIQKRYAGDQERIQLETARLYKQAGVNPLAGCLPTLATIPVWIGLYRALSNVANEGLLTEGFFWIPSLAGPTTIASRQNGSGISWLFPFIDGHPPLGWSDTIAYLVLPVLLIASQYISMQIMQTPQTDDPSQKNTQLILKFLPLMIGYFALSVPSGLSLYWLTNNVLSTGQQVFLRKLGGAKPAVSKDGTDIISAGQALRSISSPTVDLKAKRRGERFKQLKAAEAKGKLDQGQGARHVADAVIRDMGTLSSETEEDIDAEKEDQNMDLSLAKQDSLEEIYKRNGDGASEANSPAPKRSKRSKRKHAA
eukprot:c22672_g1_i1 orf=263-1804(+)